MGYLETDYTCERLTPVIGAVVTLAMAAYFWYKFVQMSSGPSSVPRHITLWRIKWQQSNSFASVLSFVVEITEDILRSVYFQVVLALVLFVLTYAKVVTVIVALAVGFAWFVSVFGFWRSKRFASINSRKRLLISIGIAIIVALPALKLATFLSKRLETNSTEQRSVVATPQTTVQHLEGSRKRPRGDAVPKDRSAKARKAGMALPLSPNNARIEITEVHVVSTPSKLGSPSFWIYYANLGPLPTYGLNNAYNLATSETIVDDKTIEGIQDTILHLATWPQLMKDTKAQNLYRGSPAPFVIIPDRPSDIVGILIKDFDAVAAGRKVLYLFVTFKYHDNLMSENENGVTEVCRYISNGINLVERSAAPLAVGIISNCGRNREFIETVHR
jgi:hypothetical protein